jgi:hypothetical protein
VLDAETGKTWTVYESMTAESARAALAAPLVFGDTLQIEAIHYLARLDEARRRMTYCKVCGGDGRLSGRRKSAGALCGCVRDESPQMLRDLGV